MHFHLVTDISFLIVTCKSVIQRKVVMSSFTGAASESWKRTNLSFGLIRCHQVTVFYVLVILPCWSNSSSSCPTTESTDPAPSGGC